MINSLLITISFPPQIGGVQTALHKLCQNYTAIDVTVLAPKDEGWQKFDEVQSFAIHRVGLSSKNIFKTIVEKLLVFANLIFGSYIYNLLKFGVHTIRLFRNKDFSIVQCGHIENSIFGYLIKRLFKIPYVIHVHGKEIKNMYLRHPIDKYLTNKFLQGADLILADNEYSKQVAINLGMPETIVENIHLGVDLDLFEKKNQEVVSLTDELNIENHQIVLSVGRLVRKKGHDIVIQSLPKVLLKIPDLLYLIVGDGPLRNELEELVRIENVQNNVRFLGAVSHENIPAFYHACDVFIMPSRDVLESDGIDVESFGIVYLEANACFKPVIGGKSGGVNEAVVDDVTGILVNPDSIEDVSQALLQLLLNKQLAKLLGENGRKRVEEIYNWKVITKVVEPTLVSLVK